jgi:hypothetical protein
MKFKKVNYASVQEWDKLVEDTYKKPYSFQQQDGCKPRGTFKFTVPCEYGEDYERDTIKEEVNGPEKGVSFKAWLARDPKTPLKDEDDYKTGSNQTYINMWWERNFYPTVEMIIQDLQSKGLLELGEYVIDIDW